MDRTRKILWTLAAAFSLIALAAERTLTPYERSPLYDKMTRAAGIMASAESLVRSARAEAGIAIDPVHDPNKTGMIGVEYSETTTSMGELEAKRTTANPDMAALAVSLLWQAGVHEGDAIAIGASGSFPAMTLAVLSAARALNLDVALVVSLGASTWGANMPDFSYLKMHAAARSVLGYDILAVSLGGGRDSGGDMTEEGRAILRAEMSASGIYVIDEKDTPSSVAKRATLYDNFFFGRHCSAFVNIGGATANVGEGLTVLELAPGVNGSVPKLKDEDRGMVYEMGLKGIPVVHLLNIKKLAMDNGVPWDPVPFPQIGRSRVYRVYDRGAYRRRLILLIAAYGCSLGFLAAIYRKASGRGGRVS